MSAVAFLLTALAAFGVLFTTWAPYDDEGYILWTLIHHAQGHILYEEIYTQYGPAFYLLDSGFRAVFPIAYSTDGQRWQTLLFWLGTSLILWRSHHLLQSRSPSDKWPSLKLAISLAIFGLVFWHQERLALEPGHPQIWCTLFVSIAIYMFASKANTTSPLPSWIFTMVLGVLAGLLIMIKPNVGVLLLAAFPAAYLWTDTSRSSLIKICEFGYTIGLVSIPWVLTFQQISSLDTSILPIVATLSILGVRYIARISRPQGVVPTLSEHNRLIHLSWLTLSVTGCLALVVLWAGQRGVSPLALKQALFGQHSALMELYFFPAIRSPIGYLGFCLLCALIAYQLTVSLSKIRSEYCQKSDLQKSHFDFGQFFQSKFVAPSRDIFSWFFIGCSAVAAFLIWCDAIAPLGHGLRPRGCAEWLLALSPVIAAGWLALRLPILRSQSNSAVDISRTIVRNETETPPLPFLAPIYPYMAIALIASLQPLISFPVPGTQLALGTLPLLVLLIDGCQVAIVQLDKTRRAAPIVARSKRLNAYLAAAAVFACLPIAFVTQRYWERESLDLPGAKTLRLGNAERASTRELILAVTAQRPDAIVFRWHNRPSWYLWANINPPYEQLPPSWTYLVHEKQQAILLGKLSKYRKVLIIDEDYVPQRLPPKSPLQQAWNYAPKVCELNTEFSLHLWSPN
jgi:hypothetical protein